MTANTERFTFRLIGPVPSKKNGLRPTQGAERARRKSGLVYKDGIGQAITDLSKQMQWNHPQLLHPDVIFLLNPAIEDQDKDGMVTTLIDLLKKARVIRDDSIRWFNGTQLTPPARWNVDGRTGLPVTEVIISGGSWL